MESEIALGSKTEVEGPSFDHLMAAVGSHPYYASIQMHFLFEAMQLSRRVSGDVVELGVFQGASAVMIARYLSDRTVWLFDSFDGMHKADTAVDVHRAGEFTATSLEMVQKRLAGLENVRFVPGWFPQSIEGRADLPQKLSFAHVDLDLYESTKNAVEWVWPRLSVGGLMVCHDWKWPKCPGVEKALYEFFGSLGSKVEVKEGRYIIAIRKI